jgi:hypothetical protein
MKAGFLLLRLKSNGMILSFVTGEQYGGWVRRPLGKAASAGRYANQPNQLLFCF